MRHLVRTPAAAARAQMRCRTRPDRTFEQRPPGVSTNVAADQIEQRRFACPVRAENPKRRARIDVEAYVVNDLQRAKTFGHALQGKYGSQDAVSTLWSARRE